MRQQLLELNIGIIEAGLRVQRGEVVMVEDAVGLFVRSISDARSKLEEIPERLIDGLPASMPRARRLVARIARREVRRVLIEVADVAMRLLDSGPADNQRKARRVKR